MAKANKSEEQSEPFTTKRRFGWGLRPNNREGWILTGMSFISIIASISSAVLFAQMHRTIGVVVSIALAVVVIGLLVAITVQYHVRGKSK